MSAKDLYHDAVVNALEKEDWIVTDDPLRIRFLNVELPVNLGIERNGEKIAVLIKHFINPLTVSDFHGALGEYLNCREGLMHNDPGRALYLAIPLTAYETFFRLRFGQHMVRKYQVHLVVYNPATERIIKWLPQNNRKGHTPSRAILIRDRHVRVPIPLVGR